MRQNLNVFSLYCNPDLDDRIFYCLQTLECREWIELGMKKCVEELEKKWS